MLENVSHYGDYLLNKQPFHSIFITSAKMKMKTSACRDGTLKNQPKKMQERHHNTFTPSVHLVPFCQLYFVLVSCVHSRVMEGSWEGIAVWEVHVDVHGECVCCGWMQYGCSRRDVLGWLLFMVMKYPLFPLLEKS